ncbi:MAG: hypothetical protein MUC56_06200 [Thermoanaerobaculales bacterium]|nr:hypothetical protein [Thermoanaerobaculales bacterium]
MTRLGADRGRWAALVLVAVVAAAGCDSVELTIGVEPGPGGALVVANANDREWHDARLLVEAVESDNSTTVCDDRTVERWPPRGTVTVPACGAKIRLTLTTGGETARFAWANGTLYRRFGRKEVPVGSS